jgi:hypothetical protein
MSNRGAVVASFLAGVILVALAVVAYGPASAGTAMSLAEKKAALKQAVKEQLASIKFGAQSIGNAGTEEGNMGAEWNTHVVRPKLFVLLCLACYRTCFGDLN